MLTLYDEFAGWGGASQGASAVPGVELVLAANHAQIAIEVHQLNFPDADHHLGDVTKADLTMFRRTDLAWYSPACPAFSNGRGEKQYFDAATKLALFEDPTETPEQRAKRLDLVKRRALMEEVPRHLQAMALRGEPVLAGCVENVVQARRWDQFERWRREIEDAGPYDTKLIALNAMHARGVRTRRAPQSRDRLFLAFWLRKLGRTPDWDKWLRPRAWCDLCGEWVDAIQVFKDPKKDMGIYGIRNGQYVYRCPRVHGAWKGSTRPGVVQPEVLPASVAIDWALPPGQKIGERVDAKGRPDPLEPATIRRIEAGLRRHARPITLDVGGHTFERTPGVRTWPVDGPLTTFTTTATRAVAVPPMVVTNNWHNRARAAGEEPLPTCTTATTTGLVGSPMLVPAGGTWREDAVALDEPMPTRTTRETDGLVLPPLLVPTLGEARERPAYPADEPLRTQTTRQETGVVLAPFLASLRGGGSKEASRGTDEPLWAFTASGTHHLLVNAGAMVVRHFGSRGDGGEHCTPVDEPIRTLTTRGHQSLVTWDEGLLVPYYGTGTAHTTSVPVGAFTTRDRYALVVAQDVPVDIPVEECTFRMLEPSEIAAGMAFADDYRVKGTKRQRVAGYGNAVCPPCAEVIMSALVEAITGEDLPR